MEGIIHLPAQRTCTRRIHNRDTVGITMFPGHDFYTLTAMVESNKGEQIIRDIVPVVEDILRPGHVP